MKTFFLLFFFLITSKINFLANSKVFGEPFLLNTNVEEAINTSRKGELNDLNIIDPSTWRGVNLPLLSKSNNEKNLSQSDFDYAASAGANVIRLTVHADPNDKRFIP